MTRLGSCFVAAENLSIAWLETTKLVLSNAGSKAFHTVTRIEQPSLEDQTIRAGCEALLRTKGHQHIDTVANTIFPRAMAEAARTPGELVERYRTSYPLIRRFGANKKGTYFGRIVEHPSPSGEHDQLVPLIDKLRREAKARTPMSARYEVRVADPEDNSADANDVLQASDMVGLDVPVFSPHRDTSRRAFPCLSMLSFQLDGDHVHVLAQYRYEYLISKGYGNYLGIAQLLSYVATEAELMPGRMTVSCGRVQVDGSERQIAHYVGKAWDDA
ncbi:MAG: hypothetical protein ACRCYU_18495 [Nocardioides sp.]